VRSREWLFIEASVECLRCILLLDFAEFLDDLERSDAKLNSRLNSGFLGPVLAERGDGGDLVVEVAVYNDASGPTRTLTFWPGVGMT